jgi:CBS domain-containing protein
MEPAMQARDLMTTDVVSVSRNTPIRDIAVLLLEHHISAVPAVDAAGMVVGMVSGRVPASAVGGQDSIKNCIADIKCSAHS